MSFDPTRPQPGEVLDADLVRSQLNALAAQIAAVPAGPPGPGLNFLGDWNGGTTYLPGDVIFHDGQAFVNISAVGGSTPEGDLTHWRTLTIAGPPGEVTTAQLTATIAGTAQNPTSVSALGLSVSDPPTQAEMQALAAKVDELLAALKR